MGLYPLAVLTGGTSTTFEFWGGLRSQDPLNAMYALMELLLKVISRGEECAGKAIFTATLLDLNDRSR